LKAVQPVFRLQGGPRAVDVDEVLRVYTEMYDAFFDDRASIPPGQLIEVVYEDLARDPVAQVQSIYESLSLGDFASFRLRRSSLERI
jgi:LPS sulfotransferase NodH